MDVCSIWSICLASSIPVIPASLGDAAATYPRVTSSAITEARGFP
jgi:hypothetical protein